MDKSLVLRKIQDHYNFKKDGDFASFLGINQSTLSNWHSRGTMDYEKIISKCEEIDANWLLTGEGKMIKDIPIDTSLENDKKENIPDEKREGYITLRNNKEVKSLLDKIEGLEKIIEIKDKENEFLRMHINKLVEIINNK